MGPQQHESISLASFNAVYTLFSSGGRRFYHSSNFRAVPRCFLASRMRIHHSSSSPAVPELCFRYMIPCCFRAVPGKMNACAAQQPVVLHGGNSCLRTTTCFVLPSLGCCTLCRPFRTIASSCQYKLPQCQASSAKTRLKTIVSTACSSSSASSSDANTDDDADSSRPAKRNRPPSVGAAGGGSAGGKGPAVVQASAAAGATAACVPGSPAKRVCI